ncbi:e3 ubiquitin-protein ligase [Anaeramoeba flamelloides]|uniref:E3 ubiquitin-protein ligase n=1 Tax=Anaeramoeba flamelloides TaxID=1746091 RepID=A0ABQ8XRX8_9EUKA|nr:e3 ubiquitin-protein ligase [Anaeramoeba flamelloides]
MSNRRQNRRKNREKNNQEQNKRNDNQEQKGNDLKDFLKQKQAKRSKVRERRRRRKNNTKIDEQQLKEEEEEMKKEKEKRKERTKKSIKSKAMELQFEVPNFDKEKLEQIKRFKEEMREMEKLERRLKPFLIYFFQRFPYINDTVLADRIYSVSDRLLKNKREVTEELTKEFRKMQQKRKTKVIKNINYTNKSLMQDAVLVVPDIEEGYLQRMIYLHIDFEVLKEQKKNPLHTLMDIITKSAYPKKKIDLIKKNKNYENEIKENQNKNKNKKNKKDQTDEKEEEEEKYCKSCLYKHPVKEMVSCKAGHLVCKGCLYAYVKEALGRSTVDIKCPCDENCKEGFTRKMIQRAVPEKTFYYFQRLSKKFLCTCCYLEYPFIDSVSCNAGHMFCKNCLHTLVKVAIGKSQTKINCPSFEKCEKGFSDNSIEIAVPAKTYNYYKNLVREEILRKLGNEQLIRCPQCNYAVVASDYRKNHPSIEEYIFECLNPDCYKDSCLLCGKDAHPGYECEYNEKSILSEEDEIRKFIEEEKTKALLRVCNKCGQNYFKTQGCNKVICSNCGEYMCYLCQKSINDVKYGHFSYDENGCHLFTGPEEDDLRIQRAENEAIEKVERLLKNKGDIRKQLRFERIGLFTKKY